MSEILSGDREEDYVAIVDLPIAFSVHRGTGEMLGDGSSVDEGNDNVITLGFKPATMLSRAIDSILAIAKGQGRHSPDLQKSLDDYVRFALMDFLGVTRYPLDEQGLENLEEDGYRVTLVSKKEYYGRENQGVCPECGDGIRPAWDRCSTCDSLGEMPCPTCGLGEGYLRPKGSFDRVACPTCLGAGKIGGPFVGKGCPTCHGEGEVNDSPERKDAREYAERVLDFPTKPDPCPECTRPCPICGGSGFVLGEKIHECEKDEVHEAKPCPACGGEGIVPTPRDGIHISTSLTQGLDICPDCGGSGRTYHGDKDPKAYEHDCPTCHGKGEV